MADQIPDWATDEPTQAVPDWAKDAPAVPHAVAQLPGFQARQHAVRGMIRAGGPEKPAGQDALEADLSGERNTPEQLAQDWKQAGKGAVASTFGLGAVGDIEGVGRQAINKLTPLSPSLKTEDQIFPPTSEGGVLGPRGIGGIGGSRIMDPAKDEREAKNMNVGAGFASIPAGGLFKAALTPAAKLAGMGASKFAEVNRAPRPVPRGALIKAELAEMDATLARQGETAPTPPPDTGMVPRDVRGANVSLLPPATPHLPEPTPPAFSSAGAAGRSIVETMHPEAISKAREALKTEFPSPDEFVRHSEEEMSPHHFMLESGDTPYRYARGIAADAGQGSSDIRGSFRERAREAPERIGAINDRYLGEHTNAFDAKRLIIADRDRASTPVYNAFRNTEIPMTPALQELVQPLKKAGAFAKAKELNALTPGAEPLNMKVPTAQTWDLVKRALDSRVGPLLRKGDKVTAGKLIDLKGKLIEAIDNHPDPTVRGVWRTARETYAGPSRIKDAIELGENLLSDKVNPHEFAYKIQTDLNPEEVQGIFGGLRSSLDFELGRIHNRGELQTLSKLISRNNQIKLQALLGEEDAANYVRELTHEYDMHHSPRNIIHNSISTPMASDRELVAPKRSLIDRGISAYETARHPIKGAAKEVGQRMSAASARETAQINADLARILTMQGPTRTAVGRYLLESDPVPHKKGGRVIKRADGGRAELTTREFPRVDRHDIRASVPLRPGLDLTGSAYAVPEVNGVGAPVSMGRDWGATIGLRKGFDDGGDVEAPPVAGVSNLTDWANRGEPGDAQEAQGVAAHRLARGAQHYGPLSKMEPEGYTGVSPSWMMEPDLMGVQSGNVDLPPGVKLDDAGRPFYPDTGKYLDVVKRPGLLPIASTPDGPQFVMPKLLDLASNVMSPLAAGKVPVKAGEMVLGSGAVRTTKNAESTAPIVIRESGDRAHVGTDAVAGITKPGHFYRGMSNAEYEATIGGGGGAVSRQDFSIPGEGTSWSDSAQDAESYANFGRTDPRKTGKPNYIVEVSGDEGLTRDKDGYFKASGEIPRDRITRVIKMDPHEGSIVGTDVSPISSKPAQPFYSSLERALDRAKLTKGTPEQWAGYLRNQPGVKADEMDPLLGDWLKEQKGPITKQQIADHIRDNKVEVKAVQKGGSDIMDGMSESDRQKFDETVQERVSHLEDEWAMEQARQAADKEVQAISTDVEQNPETGRWRYVLSNGEKSGWAYGHPDSARGAGGRAAAKAHGDAYDERKWYHFENISEDAWQNAEHGGAGVDVPQIEREVRDELGLSGDGTKWADYQLPGGENYREKLLTLPEKPSKFDPSQVEIKRHMQSLTQGETSIWYGGKKIMQYGDDPVLQPSGGYDQKPKSYWMDVAKQLYDKGDRINKVPSRSENFASGHWDEPNVLAHVRMNDRMIAAPGDNAPRKSLHLEEIQSDWHQQGRARGYKTGDTVAKRQAEIEKRLDEIKDMAPVDIRNSAVQSSEWAEKNHPEYTRLRDELFANQRREAAERRAVPDAPFKKTWHELALKHALQDAVKDGYDRLSWTPGEAQAARYDLSKHISSVSYAPETRHLYGHDHNGTLVLRERDVPPEKLADYVGKDVAKKLLETKPALDPGFKPGSPGQEKVHSLSGVDLKVGGEGMKGFYDQIVPKALEKLTKKYGVKVKGGEAPADKDGWHITPPDQTAHGKWMVKSSDYNSRGLRFDTEAEAVAAMNKKIKHEPVHYIDIPQALKDDIIKHGQPLFARGGAVRKAKKMVVETAAQLAMRAAVRRATNGD